MRETAITVEPIASWPPAPQAQRSPRPRKRTGQAIVELAVVSVAFFAIIFGVIDIGRAIYAYSELSKAVGEGARYGEVNPGEAINIKNRVIGASPSLDLAYGDILVSCEGGCTPESSRVTVEAEYEFTAVIQEILGIGPITLRSEANVDVD